MVNSVTLIGRLGNEPISKKINEQSNVSFSLATTETFKDKSGQKQEQTEWHNVQAWRALADIIAKYCHKGDLVYISGKIHYRSWELDGVKHYATDIIAQEMRMLGGKPQGAPQETKPQGAPQGVGAIPPPEQENYDKDDNDLPF